MLWTDVFTSVQVRRFTVSRMLYGLQQMKMRYGRRTTIIFFLYFIRVMITMNSWSIVFSRETISVCNHTQALGRHQALVTPLNDQSCILDIFAFYVNSMYLIVSTHRHQAGKAFGETIVSSLNNDSPSKHASLPLNDYSCILDIFAYYVNRMYLIVCSMQSVVHFT